MTDPAALEALMHADLLDAHFGQGLQRKIAERILSQPDVASAIDLKQAAGATILQILAIVGQYALTYLTTGTIHWPALLAALEAIMVPLAQ